MVGRVSRPTRRRPRPAAPCCPIRRAFRLEARAAISSLAGWMPPINSTTMSTSGRSTSAAASLVNSSLAIAAPRGRATSATAMPTSSRVRPDRLAMSSPWVINSSAKAPPTLPQPKRSDVHRRRTAVCFGVARGHGNTVQGGRGALRGGRFKNRAGSGRRRSRAARPLARSRLLRTQRLGGGPCCSSRPLRTHRPR